MGNHSDTYWRYVLCCNFPRGSSTASKYTPGGRHLAPLAPLAPLPTAVVGMEEFDISALLEGTTVRDEAGVNNTPNKRLAGSIP